VLIYIHTLQYQCNLNLNCNEQYKERIVYDSSKLWGSNLSKSEHKMNHYQFSANYHWWLFLKWFSMILWSVMMIWWCMTCYDFLFETIWYACMDAWMHEWNLLFFFIFSIFINLRNVGGVMHMHTLRIIDDVWHAMIFFLNLDDDACMDAWMHGWNLLFFIFLYFNLRAKKTRLRG